ncbi:MAG: inositol monophosphatase [Alicyclobacillus sp.]|nr:inositol monophosphatase [Alicyclobacillus sp.]
MKLPNGERCPPAWRVLHDVLCWYGSFGDLHREEDGGLSKPEDLRAVLQVAAAAALEAGDYFQAKLDEVKQVKTKSSPSDLVTEVDPACERMIRTRIHAQFPDHAVLGEETTAPGAEASAAAVSAVAAAPSLWIVDPLDGTTNFVYGIPLSAVSIGYAEAGELRIGVIYDPYRQEVFYAVRGSGAWLATKVEMQAWLAQGGTAPWPGRRLAVSTQTELAGSVVATGFPSRASARDKAIAAGLAICGRAKSFRAFGSAALHLAYVACGRIDGFWEHDLNAWDLAGGVLLIQEAGGTVASLSGEAYHLETRDVVATGHSALAETIRSAISSAAGVS